MNCSDRTNWALKTFLKGEKRAISIKLIYSFGSQLFYGETAVTAILGIHKSAAHLCLRKPRRLAGQAKRRPPGGSNAGFAFLDHDCDPMPREQALWQPSGPGPYQQQRPASRLCLQAGQRLRRRAGPWRSASDLASHLLDGSARRRALMETSATGGVMDGAGPVGNTHRALTASSAMVRADDQTGLRTAAQRLR